MTKSAGRSTQRVALTETAPDREQLRLSMQSFGKSGPSKANRPLTLGGGARADVTWQSAPSVPVLSVRGRPFLPQSV